MAILVAVLIETYGGAVGSVIGTVPSTIMPAVFLILSDSTQDLSTRRDSALASIIGVFATNVCFMPIWKIVPPKLPKKWSNGLSVLVTSVVSLLVWFVAAILLTLLQQAVSHWGISMYIFGLIVVVVTVAIGACLCWRLPPTPAGKNKVKWYVNAIRGIVAAVAIFVSGLLSQSGAGIAAGAASTFPAIFLTTMVSVSLAQGADVSTGAIGPLLLGGVSSAWYTLVTVALFVYAHWNLWLACVIGFVATVVFWNMSVYRYVKWRRDVTARKTQELVISMSNEVEVKVANGSSSAKEVEMTEKKKESNEEIEGKKSAVGTLVEGNDDTPVHPDVVPYTSSEGGLGSEKEQHVVKESQLSETNV